MTFLIFYIRYTYLLLIFQSMKRLFSLLFFISILFSTTLTYADFFEEQIVGADPETAMIQDITLNNISLSESKEINRYKNTSYFITSIKNEAINRFNGGTIPLYRRYDIITSLDSFVYTMNQYFLYQKRYELTGKILYKEGARSYLEDSK